MPPMNDANLAAVVTTSQGDYRVIVGSGVVSTLPSEFELAGLGRRAFLIADQAVFPVAVRRADAPVR